MESFTSRFPFTGGSRRTIRGYGMLVAVMVSLCCLPGSIQAQNARTVDVKNRIEQARSLERLREYNSAAEVLERVLLEAPNNASALNGLLRVYFQLKAYDRAIPLLEIHLERTPDNISYRRRLADAFYRTGRTEEADAQVGFLLDRNPENEGVVHQIGSLYTGLTDFERAVQVYLAGRERLGKRDAFSIQLAGLYTTMLDIPGAVREYVRWLSLQPAQADLVNDRIDQLTGYSSPERVEESLRNAVMETPGSKEAHDLFGNFYLRHGKPRESLAEYRIADRLDGSGGTYLARFAELALREGHDEEAIEIYQELIQSAKADDLRADASIGLATAYRKAGRFDQAAASYREVIARYPGPGNREEAMIRLAGIYLDHDHDARLALATYRTLLDDVPSTAFREDALFGMARCNIVLGSLEDAAAQYNRILDPGSGFNDAETQARAHFRMGEIALYQGRLDEALDRFHETADRYTESPYANDALEWTILLGEGRHGGDESFNEYIRSVLLRRQFRDQDALDAGKSYIDQYPESLIVDTVILDIGLILDRTGRPFQAVAALRDLIERHPESRHVVAARWRIAGIYETKIGDIPRALAEYETLLMSHPTDYKNDSVRRKIRELTEKHPPMP